MTDRMKAFCRSALIGLALVALGTAVPGSSDDRQDRPSKAERRAREAQEIRTAVQRGEIMPLPRILKLAQAQVKGNVLEVELEHERGRITYEIKILAGNGRVREVKLDARNGTLIEIEDD